MPRNFIASVLVNNMANAINDGDTFKLLAFQNEVGSILNRWEDHIRWTAQTVHQAYHQEHPGTWETCPKNVCDAAQQVLGIKQ